MPLTTDYALETQEKDKERKAANPPPETDDSKLESQGAVPPISPTLHRAKTIAFQLNSQLLIYLLSFGFIKGMKKKPADAAEHPDRNGATPAAAQEKPDEKAPEAVKVSETTAHTGGIAPA
ncbi:hypothetical protein GP486_007992 [Trichoglossum hirsutum]|uniref:Uncharacterized protein n=1 Tax=Trichoglossum hirsutum TaxID=265104 RepID=A0A9P8L4G5_9PEZI|nr:hypothetical protein GP486_007992 [Trichoglossum hirsutum]